MNYIKCPVNTICIGLAASMGAVLLAAGTKGKRMATKNAEIMIHQPLISGGLSGQATEIKIHADHMVKTREKLNKLLSERTGQPLDIINKDTERDNYMTAQEALEYGLIDGYRKTYGPIKKLLGSDLDVSK
jgi:ATP-dependent Clp protease protease subunit